MLEAVGEDVGVKASGGIRTFKDTLTMIEARASRIGTSHGVAIMEDFEKIGASNRGNR